MSDSPVAPLADESLRRSQIREIQEDSSLSSSQKLQRMQEVMGRTVTPRPVYNFPAKDSPSYQDEEEKIYGCKHYQRKCKIQAKCCEEWMVCRLCHDDVVSDHEIDRCATTKMLCMVCQTEQPISQTCIKCEEAVSTYFCAVCNLLDSTPSKKIFHCDKCKMCRIGAAEEYTHCDTCNICLHSSIMGNHECLNNAFDQNCPICFEYLATSVKGVVFLPCRHPIHQKCYKAMLNDSVGENFKIARCPTCQKSVSAEQLQLYSQIVGEAIERNPLPAELQKEVYIICKECNIKSKVPFHVYGCKCPQCNFYNTVVEGADDTVVPDVIE